MEEMFCRKIDGNVLDSDIEVLVDDISADQFTALAEGDLCFTRPRDIAWTTAFTWNCGNAGI
jgi:hypothetical protein